MKGITQLVLHFFGERFSLPQEDLLLPDHPSNTTAVLVINKASYSSVVTGPVGGKLNGTMRTWLLTLKKTKNMTANDVIIIKESPKSKRKTTIHTSQDFSH